VRESEASISQRQSENQKGQQDSRTRFSPLFPSSHAKVKKTKLAAVSATPQEPTQLVLFGHFPSTSADKEALSLSVGQVSGEQVADAESALNDSPSAPRRRREEQQEQDNK